jgi:hypothetical protein
MHFFGNMIEFLNRDALFRILSASGDNKAALKNDV